MELINNPIQFFDKLLSGLLEGFGIPSDVVSFILIVIGAGILAVSPLMLTIGLIWLERKILARFQDRLGPNRVGPWGIFQTIPDMIKIFTKEYITPTGVEKVKYNLAPVLGMASVLMLWTVIPLSSNVYGVNINVGVLYIVAVGALGELAVLLAGWGSNNKYALLGAFRAVAQLLSYEVPMVLVLLIPVMLSGSMGMNDIAQAQTVPYILYAPVAALIFFISSIAEEGRSPFDVLEADSELVSGFNIEYSGLKFGFFYVADFLHAFTSALLFAALFLGGWQGPWVEQFPFLGFGYMMAKTAVMYFLGLLLRASLPRFRIDQIMGINWKIFTPLAMVLLVLTALLDKTITVLLPEGQLLIIVRVTVMFAMNIVVIFATSKLMGWYQKRKPRRKVVVTKAYPVARPENVVEQAKTGVN